MAVPEGEEKVVVMHCGHSIFMNCVPIKKNDTGPDVLAKNHSIVRNTLFKSAKFYPQPNHADKVVGICLYDCGFQLRRLDFYWILGCNPKQSYFSNRHFTTASCYLVACHVKG